MEKLDKFLTSSLAKKGLGKAVIGAQICFYALEWGNSRFEPISFSRGILKVSVSSSSAASELQMEEEKLIQYLNSKIGKKVVKSVRIINGS